MEVLIVRASRVRHGHRWKWASSMVVLFGAIFLSLFSVAAAPSPLLEYAIKATFIYKFAPFVDWPATSFSSAQAPFTICVIGHDQVGDLIDQAAAGQTAGDRPIVIHHLTAAPSGAACQILYLANSESGVLTGVRGLPVLTVTDSASGNARGIINFVVAENHVRFDIDDDAASRSGLVISSKLLSLARQIVPRPAERHS